MTDSKDKKQNILIKHTASIHITNNISVIERKISNILLKNAYKNLLTQESNEIQIKDISMLLGWKPEGGLNQIKESLKKLVNTSFEWNILDKDKKNEWTYSTFIASAKIKGGVCTYSYSPELRRLFSAPNIYAKIDISIQSKISSKHSLALWEFLIEVKSGAKDFPISTQWIKLGDLKKLLGVSSDKSYEEFKAFNSKILKKSINEINRVTEINVSANFHRVDKKVVAVSFTIGHRDTSASLDAKEYQSFDLDLLKLTSVNLLDNENPSKKDIIREKLKKDYDFPQLTLNKIFNEYTLDQIEKVANYTDSQMYKGIIKNPKAYIVKALKENWDTSSEYIDETKKEDTFVINLDSEPIIWKSILEKLIIQYGDAVYKSWFSKLKFNGIDDDNNLQLMTSSVFIKDYIKHNYKDTITNFAKSISKEIKSVQINVL